jgi:hypothetical protein
MAEAEVKEALKTIGLEIRKALKPEQEAVAPPSFVETTASSGRQESSGQAPQSNRAEKPRPPAPEPPHAGALQVFSVTTAQLVRESDGWQVERRRLEVRGRRGELGDGVSLPLIAIPAEEFVMGSPIDVPGRRDSDSPQRRVRPEGFLMGQTPITQAQWRAVAGLKPPLAKR